MDTTLLIVEQNAKIALEISTYAYIMETGKIVLEGPSDELKNNPDVKEFYMGDHPGRWTKIIQRRQILQTPQALDVAKLMGSRFKVQGSRFRGSRFWVQSSGFKVQGLWFRVQHRLWPEKRPVKSKKET